MAKGAREEFYNSIKHPGTLFYSTQNTHVHICPSVLLTYSIQCKHTHYNAKLEKKHKRIMKHNVCLSRLKKLISSKVKFKRRDNNI